MTEKRFTKYVPDSYGYTYITTIIDNEKNKQTGNIDEIVDMLNELNDKCEFLEIENESLEDGATKYAELYHKSLKENEQLKKQLSDDFNQSNCITVQKSIISDLKKENEQLKLELATYKEGNETLKATLDKVKNNG